jgi:hypothetical protein
MKKHAARIRARGTAADTARAPSTPPPASLLERPGIDMALRIGTATMMAFAAVLVLAHLTVYAISLTGQNLARVQSGACVLGRC